MRIAKPGNQRISIDPRRLLGVSPIGKRVGTEKQGTEKGACKEQADKNCSTGK